MKLTEILPLTIKERIELDEIIRIPASFDKFLDFLSQSEYPVQYHEGEIISMGFAKYLHELLVANLIGLLFNALRDSNCQVIGSNQLIHIPGEDAAYNADISILCEPPQFEVYRKTLEATVNPFTVIEVLSLSTRGFDLGPKLHNYKKIQSLQEVVFVEPEKALVSVFKRDQVPYQWINTESEGLESSIQIANQAVFLKDIYAGTQAK